ncbi:hypothetical protein GLOTRDRAFT_129917 [Gloeophyllum trabeum ATCC 11539]|uniref:Small ribosomal subunit protein mS41 n=1 Tax=Gloeophyllum trabeum (strain ATCC 11539 / FP-39264 / Madison 617) TaxID=670483 RepID=S7Q4Y7_GLOTA|nr:uncharacterized protein GLOTRDRAFT_129917 [Gloeophyllum trabeum ATCC 11539]EPQ54567.1 hypothetical protein GLOTRDRAFT_129917 [Gloeophyllum trabeum ATCC 11539]
MFSVRAYEKLLRPLARSLSSSAVTRPIPPKRGIESPEAFLKAIGRSSDSKLSSLSESLSEWSNFWKLGGLEMKKAGVPVKDRRYILWSMEKYRLGWAIKDFAHEPKPKKKIRGRGPSVQFGKRIRSRRDR